MSLEKIAEHIEKETDIKIKKTILEAQMKANSTARETNEKVEKIIKEANEKASILAEEKRNMERAKTNVEKTKILKNAVSDAFKKSIDNLYKSEDKFSKGGEYERLVTMLIKEAKKGLGDDAVIYMNKEDYEKFSKKEKNVKPYKKRIFGIYAESKDGKLSIDLSINKIIQRLEEKIAAKLLSRLEK
jgi:vacuolar-type H+-ATPase subunit E/Vma4